MSILLPGSPQWDWLKVAIDGEDIVTSSLTIVTFFGGDDDDMDSGETASGIDTKGHPLLMACALPLLRPHLPQLAGSPLPEHVPWRTMVRFFNPTNTRQIEVPLIDLGPSLYVMDHGVKRFIHHGADLTKAAFLALGGTVAKGSLRLRYRLIGGARYLTPS